MDRPPTDLNELLAGIVGRVQRVPGVEAIVLGGSRARGTATVTSDIDVGIYYDRAAPLDTEALARVAQEVDDRHVPDLVTLLGGWGPWINGGGWLTCQGMRLDFLYRDLDRVTTIIQQCLVGEFTHDYQPGHPHGFPSYIYMAEMAICQPLWDPNGRIAALKAHTKVYPGPLQQAIINRFYWEADFSLSIAGKPASRGDLSYAGGCCFRAVACLMQTLFALNEQYWTNEKGSVAVAATFRRCPDRLAERINGAFASLASEPHAAIAALRSVWEETGKLLEAVGLRPNYTLDGL